MISHSLSIVSSGGAVWPGRRALLLLLTLAGGGCAEAPQEDLSPDSAQAIADAEYARRHLDPTYVCPMHPQIIRSEAGSCPVCGMALVAREAEHGGAVQPAVELSAAVRQRMGLRTTTVQRNTLWKYIRTQGTVTYDEDRILHVHPRTDGWIENLYVRTDGVRVERKDDLADYFSPLVLQAQLEYIDALEQQELTSFDASQHQQELTEGRARLTYDLLRYLKVPGMWAMGIEKALEPREIVPIRAPQGGIVTAVRAREGAYVTPADAIFTIVDLSEIWVMVDIFEHQIDWVSPGLSAEISTPAYPGRTWEGRVDFIYPEVHKRARTLRARLEFANEGELLKPNMFVEVIIFGGPRKAILTVPREALILTGEREAVVKMLEDGQFQPVEVTTGMWQGGQVEILAGLEEDDEIVVSGQFLIDSESNLRASLRRLAE
jgi:Cu(I)/Ag(I) efflux system membrane fusion protein